MALRCHAAPSRRISVPCFAFAKQLYADALACCALLRRGFAQRSYAFAAPYISLSLQNNAKRCFSNANPFLSKLRIAIAVHSSAIAWASMAFPLPRLSKQFLRFFEDVSGKLQRVGQLFAVGFGLDGG